MSKIFLVILVAIQLSISQAWPPVTNFTYYWNPQAGDTVTFAKWDNNNDSVRAGTGRIITELNSNVVHFNQGTANHDSVVHYVRIDTIRSNPDIDSIKGKPFIDVVKTDSVRAGHEEYFTYDEGSFTCTFTATVTGGFATALDTIGTAYWAKIGRFVTIVLTDVNFTTNGSTMGDVLGWPSEIMPSINVSAVAPAASWGSAITMQLNSGSYANRAIFMSNDVLNISNPSFCYYLR